MTEGRTSRRPWDFRYPYSAEDRLDSDWHGSDRRDQPYETYGRDTRRQRHWQEPGPAGDRQGQRGYGGGRFGEGHHGSGVDERYGDNPYGTYPSTGEVMRGDRGAPAGGWRGQRGERGVDPWPDQSRTPWRDRYDPDDDDTRASLAQAYGISDVGQLDAQAWHDDENAQRWQASSRWRDTGGRFPESERPGAGGRAAGWPGEDWSTRGYERPHGRDEPYERFAGAPQRVRWGQGSSGTGRRVAPKGYQRSDERIREDICERLAHQQHLDVGDVEVQVQNGVVTLTGTVPERHQKHRIEDLADDTFGVHDVRNQLRVQRDQGQQQRQGAVQQPGVTQGTRPVEGHVSGISTSSGATGSSASSYAGGMEVGAGEVPKGRDPYGGTTDPQRRTT